MTYEDIETFLTVVACGNFTSAAKKLFISQSVVSSRIQQLEIELGATLLIRKKGHRAISLTSYGSSFIPIASQWADLWKNTQNLKLKSDICVLRIASVDAVNNYTFVPLFKEHMKNYPHIRLSINTHHSNEIYALVENHSVDIGFVFKQITYPDIITTPIYRELMYLICHKDSLYGMNISCSELDKANEVFLNWGSDYQMWHDRHWSPEQNPIIQVNTGSMLQRYLGQPNLWAIAPMSVVQGAIASNPNLICYTLKEPPPPRICYEIKNRYSKDSQKEAILQMDDEIHSFIENDSNICTFQSYMLDR